MRSKVKRRTYCSFVLGGLVGVSIIISLPQTLGNRPTQSSLAEQAVMTVFLPVQAFFSRSLSAVGDVYKNVAKGEQLRRENESLRQRVAELGAENRLLRQLWSENQRLRRMLNLAPSLPEEKLIAEVIALSPSNWFRTAMLNVGSKDGVKLKDVVVNYRGLVGQVVKVTPRSATVLLLTDQRCGVAAVVPSSRTTGIVRGTGKRTCVLTYMPKSVPLHVGDKVVTSGLGGVFPRGLMVGTVTRLMKPDEGLSVQALVEPAVDFADLQEVFVFHHMADGVGQ